ncbi:MAG: rod shape-determining protein RodA [Flavobacteriales bacterium]|jgi:rod shape determining protein RodA|nr:rod shape-determining protein RodA [Flavobacteriales bacterium]MBT5749588.1 rod shape-determining protein RodA [Flavobacteriales bacterium]
MRAAKNIFANIDKVSIGLYALLMLFGWINIYASQYNDDSAMLIDLSSRYGKQLFFICISSFVAFLILIIDWKFFYSLSYIFYIAIILLLIGVLFKGEITGGATSWFEFGSFKFQPSEFAKFTTALVLAKYYNNLNTKRKSLREKLNIYAIIILPFLLIILQNDLGTALVYAGFVLVLYREGLSGNILIFGLIIVILFLLTLLVEKTILIPFLAGIALIIFFLSRRKKKEALIIMGILVSCTSFIFSVDYIFNDVMAPHHRKRIDILLGKEFDPHGAGYNLIQSKIAIGSGGLSGKGFLNGTQTRFDFVPEQSTDFIFCTIGEEWGFLGSFFFISLFLGLLIRVLFLAERQRSNFSRVYGYSVATILFMHFVINIGMTIGLLPVIGIPLPFISYGGSSLLGFTILLFIFLNLDSYRLQILR